MSRMIVGSNIERGIIARTMYSLLVGDSHPTLSSGLSVVF